MRPINIITGGTILGLAGAAGLFAVLTEVIQATPTTGSILQLWGRVRDFQPTPAHPDFEVTPSNGYGPYCGNVSTTLDPEGKPLFTGTGWRVKQNWRMTSNSNSGLPAGWLGKQISWCVYNSALGDSAGKAGALDQGAITSQQTFAQWFRDVPGVNMSRLWKINMVWQNDATFGPCWVYDTNDFNPVDNQLQGNGNDQHNYHFTYEIQCNFTYDAAGQQFFWFQGDDDCWVFINNQLVIDHGGIAGSRELMINLSRLGLTNGQEYTLHFFLAERHQPQSQMHIKTNLMDLQSIGTDAVLSAYD